MKVEIREMEDGWVFGIMIFRGWIILELPYRKIDIMTDKRSKTLI